MNLLSGSGRLVLDHMPTAFTNLSATVETGSPGYVIVYVDNQTIGKDVWFDDVQVLHYNTRVLEENHYYPFGLAVSTEAMGLTKQPYKYQGIELEKNFGLETYETFYRGLDPQIGRFNSIDPKAEKYYSTSPYVSMDNNPILNVDPRGDDWFVNNTNGQIVYLKGQSQITTDHLKEMNSSNKTSDFENLGSDKMFGNKVEDTKGDNVLEKDVFVLENSEDFMNFRGYDKVVRQTVEEKNYIDRSFDGGGFDAVKVETVIPLSKKTLNSDISYLKSGTKLQKVTVFSESKKQEFTNSLHLKTEVYNETVLFNKANGKSGTENSASSNLYKTGAEKGGEGILKLIKYFKSKK